MLITDDTRGGMLIDWDLCKAKKYTEEHVGVRRNSCTVRGVLHCHTNMLRINVTLVSQGTWPFIAADLLDDRTIEHSFVHDLESFWTQDIGARPARAGTQN